MICSFLRYKELELRGDDLNSFKINDIIYTLLNNLELGDYFYIWCGYRPFAFYNMILKYNDTNRQIFDFLILNNLVFFMQMQIEPFDDGTEIFAKIQTLDTLKKPNDIKLKKLLTQIFDSYGLISLTSNKNFNNGNFPPLTIKLEHENYMSKL